MKTNSTVEMEVIGDTADFKRLKFTTTKTKTSMDPSLNTRIDSIINIINKNADSLGGKSRTILLNKNNEIVDVTGLDYKKLMDMPNTMCRPCYAGILEKNVFKG